MAIIKNPLTIIKVTGGQDEPSSDARLLSYDRTTGVITGTGLGSTGTLYLLDRDTHSYVAQPTSSWSGTQITLTTPLDLEHLEGSTSIVAVTSAGWSTKLLVEGDVAVSGWGKLYIKDSDTSEVYTVTVSSSSDCDKLANSSQYLSNQITIGSTVFYRDEIVGFQFGTDYNLSYTIDYFLLRAVNLNQPIVSPNTATAIRGSFLNGCYSFNQPVSFASGVTSIGQYVLAYCHSFNQPIKLPDSVTGIGANFLSDAYSFNAPLTLSESLVSIGDSFLSNCYSFNQPLTIPNSLTTIANGFLSICYSFNQPLTIPDSVTSIGGTFLINCYSFNSPLTLSSSLTSIPSIFLSTCYSFNQELVIPDSVTSIGDNFLKDCRSFNSPLTLSSSLVSIGNSFLVGCRTFDQQLTFPSSLTSIGSDFLREIYSFGRALTLPSSITSIGSYFLFGCAAFGGLTTNTTASPTDNYSLAAYQNTMKMYVKGITITGSGASTWVTNLPNITSYPYRKLIDGTA